MDMSHPAIWLIIGLIIFLVLVVSIPNPEKKERDREAHEYFKRQNEMHRAREKDAAFKGDSRE
jgi:hypothetical protein